MTLFINAQRLASSQKETGISTGSPQLDELTSGIKAEALYLFYGEEGLTDTLFTHLLAHSLNTTRAPNYNLVRKPSSRPRGDPPQPA